MQTRFVQRASSFCMALVLTLAMLGGINMLSQPQDSLAQQWAQQDDTARA
jgi:hypothetical protein